IIFAKKFLKDCLVEAGLDPANLLVPLTQTFRQEDRRPLSTKRLIYWTKPNTSATANNSDPSSSSGMASQKEQSPLSEAPRRRRKETQSALNSRSQGAPPIPDGELVPYEITPSGQILLKGEVGGSFLHSVQWTEDYLAVQNRWV